MSTPDSSETPHTSEAAEAPPAREVDVFAVEAALRPLRRLLVRGAAERSGESPYLAAALARLATPLASITLLGELDEARAALHDGLVALPELALEARPEAVHALAPHLRLLDDLLGLPLEKWRPRRPRRRRTPPRRAREASAEAESSADASPSEAVPTESTPAESAPADSDSSPRKGRRGSSGRRRRGRKGGRDSEAKPTEEVPLAWPELPRPALVRGGWDVPLTDLELPDDSVRVAAEAGVSTVADLLLRAPTDAQALVPVHGAGRPLPEGPVAIGGRVRARVTRLPAEGGAISEVHLKGAGPLTARWHRPFDAGDVALLPAGQKVVLGAVADAEGKVTEARVVRTDQGAASRAHYADQGGQRLDDALHDLVDLVLPAAQVLGDPVDAASLRLAGLPALPEAVGRVHARRRDAVALRRLAFDEALSLQLVRSLDRFQGGGERGIAQALSHQRISELSLRGWMEPLGDSEQAAFEDIKRDLRHSRPMRRVLFGDPAARLSDIVLHAILSVAAQAHQVLLVAPDAPSAAVIHDQFEPILRSYGVVPLLALGEPRKVDKDAISRGETHVVIASRSFLDSETTWRRLGLAIAWDDARDPSLASQLAGLRTPLPDVLEVARCPLPGATLLSDAFASWDLSQVSAPGIEPGKGTVWEESDREAAYKALGEQVSEGASGLIVFPLRKGGSDLLSQREAAALVASLEQHAAVGSRIGLLHGAARPRERQRVWQDFVEGRLQVLVATIPVELLPALPRRGVALVEHADRLDLQRLLALRAQLGSEGHVHYVLGSAQPDPDGLRRAGDLADGVTARHVVATSEDVFPAETTQPAAWRFLNPSRDTDLIVSARRLAHALHTADRGLRSDAAGAVVSWGRTLMSHLAPEELARLPQVRKGSPRKGGTRQGRRRRRRKR